MKIGLAFRNELMGIPGGTWVVEQFDQLVAGINGVWKIEHNDNGTHRRITAESGTFSGTVAADRLHLGSDVSLRVGGLAGGDLEINEQGNDNAWQSVMANDFIAKAGTLRLGTGGPTQAANSLRLVRVSASNRLRFLDGNGSGTVYIGIEAGTLVLSSRLIIGTEDTNGIRLDLESGTLAVREGDDSAYGPLKALTLESTGDVTAGDQIFERGRTAAMGEWTDVAYAAGNFTANGAMTWTVASGDVRTYAYAMVGKTMTIVFDIDTTSVGGTPSTELRIAVPGGFTTTRATFGSPISASDNGSAFVFGGVYISVGSNVVRLHRDATFATNWSASANTTRVMGIFTLEVN